ncbi:MAG: hypothetical protein IPM33_09875 [Phycisphaerales bacterium]|nr:hypothetical protein [Phycisphaerales bacterium]
MTFAITANLLVFVMTACTSCLMKTEMHRFRTSVVQPVANQNNSIDEISKMKQWYILRFSRESGLYPSGLIVPQGELESSMKTAVYYRDNDELIVKISQITESGGCLVNCRNGGGVSIHLVPLSLSLAKDDKESLGGVKLAGKGWVLYKFQSIGTARPLLAIREVNRAAPLRTMVSGAVYIPDISVIDDYIEANDYSGIRYATEVDIEWWKAQGGADMFDIE